jgi:NADPH:quinone reductase-like Zn-dependent oxidoreductase/acyl carrier protein
MVALGQIPDQLLGFEASGTVIRTGKSVTHLQPGDAVCTLAHGAHRMILRNQAILCQRIPEGLSFDEAACVPLVHCTVYHALVNVARVQKGHSILIHAASGGVGQAAIQLAQYLGLVIFVTVGTENKKSFVMETYGISEDHIFHSRDTSFAKGILRMTNGVGVDYILNSLSGEALRQTWHCLAPCGTFLEIGMKDLLNNTALDMRPFLKNRTFAAINLEYTLKEQPQTMARILQDTFDLLRQGAIKPVTPLTVYPISKVEDAMRYMQGGKHHGKIALSWSPQDVIPVLYNPSSQVQLSNNATYMVVGGLGGLGRSIIRLLVECGARHICVMSRSGITKPSQQQVLDELQSRGVITRVYKCDISDAAALKDTLEMVTPAMPPVRGVVHSAAVFSDAIAHNMTHEQWLAASRCKIQGSWNLHALLPRDLDFFLALGSFACIIGNRSQSSYAAGCAYQDGLAHYRQSLGVPATTIDLGIMKGIGVLAEKGSVGILHEWEERFGVDEDELHALIKVAIQGQITRSGPAQIVTGLATGGAAREAGIQRPYYFDDPRFSIVSHLGTERTSELGMNQVSLRNQLVQAEDVEAGAHVVRDALVARVAKSQQVDAGEIDSARPLHSYGVDSLVAAEMGYWVRKEFGVDVTVFDIMASIPMSAFARNVAEKSRYTR